MAPLEQRAKPRSFHLKSEWWPWYAVVIGVFLLLFGRGRGTYALLLGWTIGGVVLLILPLVHVQTLLRRQLMSAAGAFFMAVLVAWRLDTAPDLGALALAGNGRAIAALVGLTACLGALTASRRWIAVQSGVWFVALAVSGWWLLLLSGSSGLLSEWQQFLPYKQVEFSQTTFAFDTADAFLLSILPAGLFAIGASAGFLAKTLVGDGVRLSRPSLIRGMAFVAWLGALFIASKTSGQVPLVLFVLLAIVWGAIARSLEDLVRFSVAVAAVAFAFAALDVASSGLNEWWGPHVCHDFIGYDCTPSQQAPWVIFPLAVLPVIAALSYGVKLLLARIFGPLEKRFVEPIG